MTITQYPIITSELAKVMWDTKIKHSTIHGQLREQDVAQR